MGKLIPHIEAGSGRIYVEYIGFTGVRCPKKSEIADLMNALSDSDPIISIERSNGIDTFHVALQRTAVGGGVVTSNFSPAEARAIFKAIDKAQDK